MIRDPRDEEYPYIKSKDEFIQNPRWRYWQYHSHQPVDHIAFVTRKHYAYVDWDAKKWDVLSECDLGIPADPQLFGLDFRWWDPDNLQSVYNAYWNRHVPKTNQAWAIDLRWVPYDRILAIDDIGDRYNEGIHLLVDYVSERDPFEPGERSFLRPTNLYASRILWPQEGSRIEFFPEEIPDEREQYQEEIRKKYDT